MVKMQYKAHFWNARKEYSYGNIWAGILSRHVDWRLCWQNDMKYTDGLVVENVRL